jgi:hypothetical protein
MAEPLAIMELKRALNKIFFMMNSKHKSRFPDSVCGRFLINKVLTH